MSTPARTTGSPKEQSFKGKSGKVLQIRDLEKPVPKNNEVLLGVRAASVNPLDWRMNVDVAGVVEAVGGSVTRFKPGDAVVGISKGAFAEFACASKTKLVLMPENLTFEQAAAAPIAGAYRLTRASRQRTPLVGAEDFDQRRVWRDWYFCRSVRQVVRR
jgi:NADPH:quinone reductase-like Zn-dependent oxidoreductase